MIVKSSLAFSLGLVGALSIVRFRAAIKEPEELVYLFLVIATGLGLGANQTKITILGVLTTLVITFLFSYFKKEKIEKIEYETFQLSISRNKSISHIDTNIYMDNFKSKKCILSVFWTIDSRCRRIVKSFSFIIA